MSITHRHPAPDRCRLLPAQFEHSPRRAVIVFTLLLVASAATSLEAATVRTNNFDVSSRSESVARTVARQAEELRASLAQEWIGTALPTWPQRCVIRFDSGQERLSGDTTYTLIHGRVTGWRMELRGPVDRVLETLLPHEILHTVLASYFKDAVPRWADEGAALSVEAEADRRRLWAQEGPKLSRGSRRPLREMFTMDSYPEDRGDLRAFYAQGAAFTEFLLQVGKRQFLDFVQEGIQSGWEIAVQRHYGFGNIERLEGAWIDWILNDRPRLVINDGQTLADVVERPAHHQDVSPVLSLLPAPASAIQASAVNGSAN